MPPRSKWSWTFTWWVDTPPGPVKHIPIEAMPNYQSEYVTQFTHLKSMGWVRENGKWVSPDGKHKYDSMKAAYEYQRFYNEIVYGDKRDK